VVPGAASRWRSRLTATLFPLVVTSLLPGCARQPLSTAVATKPAVASLEGILEVLIEDSDRSSRLIYHLVSGDRRVELRFAVRPSVLTGTRVRVTGVWAADGVFEVTMLDAVQ